MGGKTDKGEKEKRKKEGKYNTKESEKDSPTPSHGSVGELSYSGNRFYDKSEKSGEKLFGSN